MLTALNCSCNSVVHRKLLVVAEFASFFAWVWRATSLLHLRGRARWREGVTTSSRMTILLILVAAEVVAVVLAVLAVVVLVVPPPRPPLPLLQEAKARSFVSQNFAAATRDRTTGLFRLGLDWISMPRCVNV